MCRPSGLNAAPMRLIPPNNAAKIGDVGAPGIVMGDERSAWYMYRLAEPPSPPERLTTMYSPSGTHSGERKRLLLPRDTCVVSVLSRRIVHRLSPPLRSEMKATDSPSGLKRGCTSKAIPVRSGDALPPVIGMV